MREKVSTDGLVWAISLALSLTYFTFCPATKVLSQKNSKNKCLKLIKENIYLNIKHCVS